MRKGESFLGGRRKGVPEGDGGGEERVFERRGSRIEGEKVLRMIVSEGVMRVSVRCKRRGGKVGEVV